MSLDSCELVLSKYCNELDSEDKRQRKRALENLKKEIVGSVGANEAVVRSFEQVYKHLVRSFKDSAEAVRELSVVIVTDILKIIPPNELYMQIIIPVLSERLSGEVVLESSEEVRLCMVNLISVLIPNYKQYIFTFMDEIINILVKTIVDPYPQVKKTSCECAIELAQSVPHHFHLQSESLIKPLIQTLNHQQYRVRVGGINAIGAVIRHGNNKSVNDVCGPLAERLFDQHHAVRAAVAEVIALWLFELPDRYSYFHKLVPIMLTCLSEEIPEHRKRAEELWMNIGHQYMLENETDLKEKMNYLTDNLDHYPNNVVRPNLGCRALVQRELSRYLGAIVVELDDWKPDVRVKSAQLLCVTVQHAESSVTQHLNKVLPALYKASTADDTRVIENIERAADLLGYLVPTDVYWRLAQPYVQESSGPGPLFVLAAVIRSAQKPGVAPLLTSMADTIASDSICYSRLGPYQKQLLSVVRSMLLLMGPDIVPVTSQLFNILVTVLGLSANPSVSKHALGLISELAASCDLSVDDLYRQETPMLLDKIAASAPQWILYSPERFVFEALLTNAGPAVGLNMSQVVSVLETCWKVGLEPEAILQTLMAVSYVLTHSQLTLSEVTDLPQTVHDLCTRVVMPELEWRAGRSAEALRTAAAGCLLAALELVECGTALATPLLPKLLSLIEDSAQKTRHFAALSILNIVKALKATASLTAEHVDTIFVVLLKRLDDCSDIVREVSVSALGQLFSPPLPADYSVEWHQSSLQALFDTLLLHLDDPQPRFQDIMLGVLKELSVVHPTLLKSRIQVDNFRNKSNCEELVKHLEHLKI